MKTVQLFVSLMVLVLSASFAAPAEAQRSGGDTEERAPLYPNATREDPEIKPSSRTNRLLQRMYESSQDDANDAETIELAQELIGHRAAGPYEKSLAYQTLAYIDMNSDDYSAALGNLQSALDAGGLPNDQHFQIMYQISQIQLQEEQYDESLATLERLIAETGEEKPEYLAMRGNALYRMERFEDAAPALKKAMDASDNPDPNLMQLLMATYFELDRGPEAAAVAEQALQRDPDNVALIRNLAAIYSNADMTDKAIPVLEAARSRGLLTDSEGYRQLYQMYLYSERESDAIATINEGLQNGVLEPGLEVYRTLGEANYFSNQPNAAIEAFTKANEFAQDGEVAMNLARVLAEEERWTDARRAANEAIEKGIKRKGDAYVVIGAAEFGLENQAAALAAYREAAKYPETKQMAESYLRQFGG